MADNDNKPGPLYKSVITIWSAFDPSKVELSYLAQEAESGSAHCSESASEWVQDPTKDPAWDGTEFFGGSEFESAEDISAVLERALAAARNRIEGFEGTVPLQDPVEPIDAIYGEWLEEVISNFADELDDFDAVVPVYPDARPIAWIDGADQIRRFLPSLALTRILVLARGMDGLEPGDERHMHRFLTDHGGKFDRVLSGGAVKDADESSSRSGIRG